MAYELFTEDKILHYHGNYVRMLFVATVVLLFVSVPIWGHVIPFGPGFEVLNGIVLIALAGLTNPHSKWVMVLNVIAAGFGAFLLELSAITFHAVDSTQLLITREAGAVLLISALYFGVKTLRAMTQGKIGDLPVPWEFEKPHSPPGE